jgi:hypothetical protein
VAVGLPRDAATLALLLVHEVQHMVLGSVLDLVDLCDNDGVARHRAPWRSDPRPVSALLQGTFAHVGVTNFWRVHRHHQGPGQRRAEFEFAFWRAMTREAIQTLAASGDLTSAGTRFVDRMATAVSAWEDEQIESKVAHAVDDLCHANVVRWRLRNHRPSAETVEDLGRRWRSGAACPPVEASRVEESGPQAAIPVGLEALLRSGALGETAPAATDGDRAYLDGDYVTALDAYRRSIAEQPHGGTRSDDAWAGLVIALRRAGRTPVADQIAQRPDLIRALYLDGIATGKAPDPEAIAAWLDEAPPSTDPELRRGRLDVAIDPLTL